MDRTDFPLFVLYFSPSFPFSPINSSHSLSLFQPWHFSLSLACRLHRRTTARCALQLLQLREFVVTYRRIGATLPSPMQRAYPSHGLITDVPLVSFDIIANHFGSILPSTRKRSVCTRHARVFPRNFVHRLIGNVRIRSNDTKFLYTKLCLQIDRDSILLQDADFFFLICRQQQSNIERFFFSNFLFFSLRQYIDFLRLVRDNQLVSFAQQRVLILQVKDLFRFGPYTKDKNIDETYVSSHRVYRRTKILKLSAGVSFKNEYTQPTERRDTERSRYTCAHHTVRPKINLNTVECSGSLQPGV